MNEGMYFVSLISEDSKRKVKVYLHLDVSRPDCDLLFVRFQSASSCPPERTSNAQNGRKVVSGKIAFSGTSVAWGKGGNMALRFEWCREPSKKVLEFCPASPPQTPPRQRWKTTVKLTRQNQKGKPGN